MITRQGLCAKQWALPIGQQFCIGNGIPLNFDIICTYFKHTVNVILHHSASRTFIFVTKHSIQ